MPRRDDQDHKEEEKEHASTFTLNIRSEFKVSQQDTPIRLQVSLDSHQEDLNRVVATPTDLVLCLDMSASMHKSVFAMKRVTMAIIKALRSVTGIEDVRVGLVVFRHKVTVSLVPDKFEDNVNVLVRHFQAMNASGGTDIALGVVASLDMLSVSPGRNQAILLITDGETTSGKNVSHDATMAVVEAHPNWTSDLAVHTVALTKFSDFALLQRLSSERGSFFEIGSTRSLAENIGALLGAILFVHARQCCLTITSIGGHMHTKDQMLGCTQVSEDTVSYVFAAMTIGKKITALVTVDPGVTGVVKAAFSWTDPRDSDQIHMKHTEVTLETGETSQELQVDVLGEFVAQEIGATLAENPHFETWTEQMILDLILKIENVDIPGHTKLSAQMDQLCTLLDMQNHNARFDAEQQIRRMTTEHVRQRPTVYNPPSAAENDDPEHETPDDLSFSGNMPPIMRMMSQNVSVNQAAEEEEPEQQDFVWPDSPVYSACVSLPSPPACVPCPDPLNL
jgi:Mg-chelatase subunit ChlD